MTEPRRAAIYVRVSDPKQEAGYSLETQEAACRKYAEEHAYQVAAVYNETQTAADLFRRRELAKLIQAVNDGLIDVVVAYVTDRFTRNQAHLYILLDRIERVGARLEFAAEIFEQTAVGKFILSAKTFAAELELEKLKERVYRGTVARARAGKLLVSGRPLFGYRYVGEKKERYEIDPATAPTVAKIFAWCVAGEPLRGISRRLEEEGLRTPTGLPEWQPSALAHMLQHPGYKGEAVNLRWRQKADTKGKPYMVRRDVQETITLPEDVVPPIVDAATWQAANDRLSGNRAKSARNNRRPEDYLLRGGYAKCGLCGGAMVANQKKDGRLIYVCGARNRRVVDCPHGTSISAPALDAAVWERVEGVLLRPEVIKDELAKLRENDPTEGDLAATDKALTKMKKQQAALANLAANLDDPDAQEPLLAKLGELAKQKKALEKERELILARQESWQAAQGRLDDLEASCRAIAMNLETLTYQQRRLALDALGVSVTVYPADHAPRWIITANIPLYTGADSSRERSTDQCVSLNQSQSVIYNSATASSCRR
ncbi:MAG: recombinase family protein [Chloroflexi bacterium]|nr:recombinase family protein [Chloroflexota bacterium]